MANTEQKPAYKERQLVRSGAQMIAFERERQQVLKGYNSQHDDELETDGQLALAAAAYAVAGNARETHKDHTIPGMWPWDSKYWKPTPDNRIKELVKAGALLAAEIDRLQRLNP